VAILVVILTVIPLTALAVVFAVILVVVPMVAPIVIIAAVIMMVGARAMASFFEVIAWIAVLRSTALYSLWIAGTKIIIIAMAPIITMLAFCGTPFPDVSRISVCLIHKVGPILWEALGDAPYVKRCYRKNSGDF
jgi:hypothetical protein